MWGVWTQGEQEVPAFAHQRSEECEISGCGKNFIHKADLADHMRSMHGFPKLKLINAQQSLYPGEASHGTKKVLIAKVIIC